MYANSKDLNAEIKVKETGGGRFVAAGAGDNTKVTGVTLDRKNGSNGLYQSCVMALGWRAVLGANATLSAALEYQLSSDGTNWDTAVVVYASTVVATDSGAGSTLQGNTTSAFDMSGWKRWVRFNHTPDLSAGSVDTGEMIGQCVMAGSNLLPAA